MQQIHLLKFSPEIQTEFKATLGYIRKLSKKMKHEV